MTERLEISLQTPMSRPRFRRQPGPAQSVLDAGCFSRRRRDGESSENCASTYRRATYNRCISTPPLISAPTCANAGGLVRSNLVRIISARGATSNKRIVNFVNLRKPITDGLGAIRTFATKAIPLIAFRSTTCHALGERLRECTVAATGGRPGLDGEAPPNLLFLTRSKEPIGQ